MGVVLFLAKPLLSLVALVVAARWFAPPKLPKWLVVVLATLARTLIGIPNLLVATLASGHADQGPTLEPRFIAVLLVLGFVAWLLVTKIAFRRERLSRLVVFAAVAELMSGAIDLWALYGLSHTHGRVL